jgi:hypothetical protein
MPSKCLLKKFEESVEDIKLIYEFYLENGGESIKEMISPVKYLIACISDILNDGVNSTKGFYSIFEQYSSMIEGIIDEEWDEFDKGLIWIIQKLNNKTLGSYYEYNYERLKPNYKRNSLISTKKQEILSLLKELEDKANFSLYQEDLYITRTRFNPKINEVKESNENWKSPITEEFLASPSTDADDSMISSFISMEPIDVKLLQEREMRNDFGFLNKLKYNSIRFVNNFRVTKMKPMRSDFRIDDDGEFESVNIFSSNANKDNSGKEMEKMEICPERGLTSQNYYCIECGNEISSKDSIKCDFNGNYLCPKCHGGKESINPIRIIRNWDFKLYPISNKSRRIIANFSYNNLINFPKINPKEFKSNEKFKQVKILREKIFKSTQKRLKAVGKAEATKQLTVLEKLAWPKTHLLTSIDLYTIEDLIEIERETFCGNVLVPLYNLLKL